MSSKVLQSKIIVIDDMNSMVRIIKGLLEQIGFKNIDTASNGVEAFEKITEQGDFNLIISDWNMVPVTGIELLEKVRSHPKLKDTPFILVTAESKTENVIAAKNKGVSNYIVKPFNLETLQKKIESVLGPI